MAGVEVPDELVEKVPKRAQNDKPNAHSKVSVIKCYNYELKSLGS